MQFKLESARVEENLSKGTRLATRPRALVNSRHLSALVNFRYFSSETR